MEEQNISAGGAFPPAQRKEHIAGPIVGGIILIITIIIAVYFWLGGDMSGELKPLRNVQTPTDTIPSAEATDSVIEELSAQGSSDEIADIEKDLEATNLNTLGEYMDEI